MTENTVQPNVQNVARPPRVDHSQVGSSGQANQRPTQSQEPRPDLNERERGEQLRLLIAAGTAQAGGTSDLDAVKQRALQEAQTQFEAGSYSQADFNYLSESIRATTATALNAFLNGYLDQMSGLAAADVLSRDPSIGADRIVDAVRGNMAALGGRLPPVLAEMWKTRLAETSPEQMVKLLELTANSNSRERGLGGGNFTPLQVMSGQLLVSAFEKLGERPSFEQVKQQVLKDIKDLRESGKFSPLTADLQTAAFENLTQEDAVGLIDIGVDGLLSNILMQMQGENVPAANVPQELARRVTALASEEAGENRIPAVVRNRALARIRAGDIPEIQQQAEIPTETENQAQSSTSSAAKGEAETKGGATANGADTSGATSDADTSPMGRQLLASRAQMEQSLQQAYSQAEEQLKDADPTIRERILSGLRDDHREKLSTQDAIHTRLMPRFDTLIASRPGPAHIRSERAAATRDQDENTEQLTEEQRAARERTRTPGQAGAKAAERISKPRSEEEIKKEQEEDDKRAEADADAAKRIQEEEERIAKALAQAQAQINSEVASFGQSTEANMSF